MGKGCPQGCSEYGVACVSGPIFSKTYSWPADAGASCYQIRSSQSLGIGRGRAWSSIAT